MPELTKIYVDLPHHWYTGGESLWALPLGGERYELRNVPFSAYGLNYLDVVRAVERAPDLEPEIVELLEESGHQTLRVFFNDGLEPAARSHKLDALSAHKASVEGANENLFAIDVEPDGNYEAIRDLLEEWEGEGILDYETCEARLPDSFDDAPEED